MWNKQNNCISVVTQLMCSFYSERNQQVMCGSGLAGVVLRVACAALRIERHPLHAPNMYMLERLAAHALRPIELR